MGPVGFVSKPNQGCLTLFTGTFLGGPYNGNIGVMLGLHWVILGLSCPLPRHFAFRVVLQCLGKRAVALKPYLLCTFFFTVRPLALA